MDTEIDAKTFWKAIGCRAIGVAIVTAKGADGPAGFLALSATHLSASPPMMMVSIGLSVPPTFLNRAVLRATRNRSLNRVLGLASSSSGNFALTDEKTGAKTIVTGPSDLEKHSANHKVTLTGAAKNDASGKPIFEVSKIQHISPSCQAPSQ